MRFLLRLSLWWMKRRLDRHGVDIARESSITERDNLVELGEALGNDNKIRGLLTIVPWETFCEWREDYHRRNPVCAERKTTP